MKAGAIAFCLLLPAVPAQAADCAAEAGEIAQLEADLPRLDILTRATDREPFCITLETIIAFAGRLTAHVTHCPQSTHAGAVAEWEKTRLDYARKFSQRRCRRTLPSSRR
jgi:hypothetical protein